MKENTMEKLAEKVDRMFRDFDPYEYTEKVADMVQSDSYQVIQILAEMVEELTE